MAFDSDDIPPPEERETPVNSPEARAKQARLDRMRGKIEEKVGPGTQFFRVVKRVAVGAFNDGFIHAGNLAYMSMLALFPFFIIGAALFSIVGEEADRAATIDAVLTALPPSVAETIEPAARRAIDARTGWLLWAGGLFGLWTVSSLIETIRDVLRRAYGTEATLAFWRYRLLSAGIIVLAVVLLMLSLLAQFLLGAAQEFIEAFIPQFSDLLAWFEFGRIIPALGLFGSIYLLFYTLTPQKYRDKRYRKWPGALAVTVWWLGVTISLPMLLSSVFSYDLTYGSLAGIMIALFFFWLIGLGVTVGAELNAALAETPEEEENRIGQWDDREREWRHDHRSQATEDDA